MIRPIWVVHRYGQNPPDSKDTLILGKAAIQGERGLLRRSGAKLRRMRYNPFYKVIEKRVLEWFDKAGKLPMRPGPDGESIR